MTSTMVTSSWFMGVLGVVVILHGGVLLTEYADRLGQNSGPLMIVYSVLMLLNQALIGVGIMDDGSGMSMNGSMATSGMNSSMSWDAGMIALAVLMLISGFIMTRRNMMAAASDEM
ncbi:hypothetical protein [Halodesulfurarchaeum sp.]|uniref:hypothetical protein n=1 Tax=Halodesulfurarchaeum sp. TaxID=1980530 RepID=UPI002FC3D885